MVSTSLVVCKPPWLTVLTARASSCGRVPDANRGLRWLAVREAAPQTGTNAIRVMEADNQARSWKHNFALNSDQASPCGTGSQKEPGGCSGSFWLPVRGYAARWPVRGL